MNNLRIFRVSLLNYTKKLDAALSNNCISPHNHTQLAGRFSSVQSLHTSSISLQNPETKDSDSPPPGRKDKKPVDWLPFEWHRRPRFDIFQQSGDTIFANTIDLSLPKPDFELSDELKNASPEVKHFFSLATGSSGEIREVCKRHLLKRIQRHPNDCDSLEVKIALKTIQIRALYVHREKFKRINVRTSRVILPIIIQKRNKLLKQLRNIDEERFQWILDELKLYYNPQPLDVKLERYCKKWALRKLTKEYCESQIAVKKTAYHEDLKMQQEAFLEEKKQVLAWIEEEEKAIKKLNV